jgi:hypothetical protein
MSVALLLGSTGLHASVIKSLPLTISPGANTAAATVVAHEQLLEALVPLLEARHGARQVVDAVLLHNDTGSAEPAERSEFRTTAPASPDPGRETNISGADGRTDAASGVASGPLIGDGCDHPTELTAVAVMYTVEFGRKPDRRTGTVSRPAMEAVPCGDKAVHRTATPLVDDTNAAAAPLRGGNTAEVECPGRPREAALPAPLITLPFWHAAAVARTVGPSPTGNTVILPGSRGSLEAEITKDCKGAPPKFAGNGS